MALKYLNSILEGDALEKLKEIPEKSINMCMTSPPYWALRDYGTAKWEGGKEDCAHIKGKLASDKSTLWCNIKNNQLQKTGMPYLELCGDCGAKRIDKQVGLEPTFDKYINNLCDIFDEVKRVLRADGTCWVNMGDTYSSGNRASGGGDVGSVEPKNPNKPKSDYSPNRMGTGLADKTLVMIPFRFAIEMVNRGWILRNTIIWHKPSCMPSSAKDRFTVDYEYIFFFSKNKKYYFEQQLEPHKSNWRDQERMRLSRETRIEYKGKWKGNKDHESYESPRARTQRPNQKGFIAGNKLGRNKRTVWTINPKPFKEAHFAVYPEELCETPIKAGCPEFVCNKCGNPKVKDIEYEREETRPGKESKYTDDIYVNSKVPQGLKKRVMCKRINRGYKSTCSCNEVFKGGIVLDPFMGAGTTGLVALKQGKNFIGIELNPEYIKIANARLKPYLEQERLNGV